MVVIVTIILAAVATVLLLPYINRAIRRGRLIRKLKKICALKKYKLELSNPFCVYFRNFSEKYDLTVDTGKVFYAVKFFDEYYQNSSFVFSGSRKVSRLIRNSGVFTQNDKHTSERYVGSFCKLVGGHRSGRREFELLLVDTEATAIFFSEGERAEKLKEGDGLYGMTLISPKRFLEGIGGRKN